MALRYVTADNVRVACGITTKFISDADMEEILEYMEEEIEQFLNIRFLPYTRIEQHEGDDSGRLLLEKNPILKLRALRIDGTDIDVNEVRIDSQASVLWLTTSAEKSSFTSRTNEKNLVRVKYDYGLLEATTTQTTISNAETKGDSVVIEVASTTGFTSSDYVEIEGMDSKKETVQISSVDAGVSITVDNLSISHEAGSMVTLLRVPKVAERLMIVACAMAAVARVVGQSFDEITGYSIGDMQVTHGEPYTQWREVNVQLQKEYKQLLQHFPIRTAIA